MLTPALRALRRALPRARITLLASPEGGQVAPLLPWIDAVLVERVLWQHLSGDGPPDPPREHGLIARIRAGGFDAALIFTNFRQSPYPAGFVCYLAGVPVRIGQSRESGGGVLSQWVLPPPDDCHQVDRNLHLLEAAGIPAAGEELEVVVPPAARERMRRTLFSAGIDPGSFILLAPGATCPARRYDPGRFAAVAADLVREARRPVVVAGGAEEVPAARLILSRCPPGVISLAGRTSLAELAALIEEAALVIANDSGAMHLAEALCRPAVVLFSGVNLESQWRPRRAPSALLRRSTPCSPCYAVECPYGMECLDVPPREVVRAALTLLRNPGKNPGQPPISAETCRPAGQSIR